MIHKHLMRQHEVLSYCEAVTNRTLFDTNKGVTIQMHDGHSLNQFLLNPRRFRIDDSVDFFWSELITAPIFSELRAETPYWKSSSSTLRSSAIICDTFLPAKDALIACLSSSVIYDTHETNPCINGLKPNFLRDMSPSHSSAPVRLDIGYIHRSRNWPDRPFNIWHKHKRISKSRYLKGITFHRSRFQIPQICHFWQENT